MYIMRRALKNPNDERNISIVCPNFHSEWIQIAGSSYPDCFWWNIIYFCVINLLVMKKERKKNFQCPPISVKINLFYD